MNLFALTIHLLFFPFGNDGYTSRSWDWVIGFGDCQKGCDEREEGYTCGNKKRYGLRCTCSNCQRDCQLSEANVNIDYCNAAETHADQVGVDVGDHLASLTADLAIGLVGAIPVVGGIASPILSFEKGLFEMGDDEDLLNSVIDDVNARLDTMNKCMGQMIAMAQVNDQIDSMQRAFYLYDLARSHQGNANDDRLDKLRGAWEEHLLVTHSEFDNVDRSADFFSKLLLPMQDFAQSFILVSFDYLIYLHELDEANYEDAYQRTIDAFIQLYTWADKARAVIKSSISNTMHALPCRNGDTIENQKSDWNAKFSSTNVYPIGSYMNRLIELNKVLTPSFSWLGCYEDKSDRAMVHLKNGVDTITGCRDLCMQNGYHLFGLQYPAKGQCFCSNDKGEAMQFGESDNCDGRGRGGVWALDIYQMFYIPWVVITKNDIVSTIASNVDVKTYNDAYGHLVVDGTLQARGCGSGDKINFGVLLADSLGGKWRKIRYTMEFISGASSCWSILGNTHYVQEHGLYGLETIDNGLSYGSWNGETYRCDNEVDNFLHVKHGKGHKGYLTVEQQRDINVDQAGIVSGFSCTQVGSVVRFKDISVTYYNGQ